MVASMMVVIDKLADTLKASILTDVVITLISFGISAKSDLEANRISVGYFSLSSIANTS